MAGNVREWTADNYGDYGRSTTQRRIATTQRPALMSIVSSAVVVLEDSHYADVWCPVAGD